MEVLDALRHVNGVTVLIAAGLVMFVSLVWGNRP